MIAWRLFETLFLGFLCGLVPGPVVTAVFTDSVRKGWHAARRTVVIAAAGEILLSFLAVFAFTRIAPTSVVFPVLSLFGALILLNLSWDLWRLQELSEEEPLFSNQRIVLLALLNGVAWMFRITVYVPLAVELGREVSGGAWLFLFVFEAGWLLSTLLFCRLVAQHRVFFQANRQLHLIYRPVAFFLVCFALKLAIASGQALLE